MQAKPVLDNQGEETGEYTYQGAVANRALELLGKNRGLFGDKLELVTVDEAKRRIFEVLTAAAKQRQEAM